MAERLIIDNFAGIKHAEIDLKPINIFIGEHATGKSVAAKLVYFMKQVPFTLLIAASQGDLPSRHRDTLQWVFRSYFYRRKGNENPFRIEYYMGDSEPIVINYSPTSSDGLRITIPDELRRVARTLRDNSISLKTKTIRRSYDASIVTAKLNELMDETFSKVESRYTPTLISFGSVFIPAIRSFFSQVSEFTFTWIKRGDEIDRIMLEFGSFYEFARNTIIQADWYPVFKDWEILVGGPSYEGGLVSISHKDGRIIPINFASSGQQELLPLLMIFALLHREEGSFKRFVGVEEPEAHVFPTTQQRIVESCSSIYNRSNKNLQFVITTHSPYILTSFNNLMQAGHLDKQGKVDKTKLNKIVSKELWLDPDNVGAYLFENGTCRSIIDPNRGGLIQAEEIDTVSEKIANQFEQLMDLAYEQEDI